MCRGSYLLFMDKNESTTNALDIMMVNAVQKKDNTFLKRLAQFLYDQNRIGAANAVETLRRNSFPVSLKEEAILVEARQYETLLRLIGIKVSQCTAWKVAKVFKA